MNVIAKARGSAHVVVIVAVLAVIIGALGYVGYNTFTKNNNVAVSESSLKADAAGAYSSVCGSNYKLIHTQYGKGFTLRNYAIPGKYYTAKSGCALVVNNDWGTPARMCVHANKKSDCGTYKHYAGPVYYEHKGGVSLRGSKGTNSTAWVTN